jgi:SNF2 family DNA or RNA helicase
MSSSPILSRATKTLLLPHDQVAPLWPDAPTLQRNGTLYSILPHNPQTQISLRALDIDAPAPILYQFDWPSADGSQPFQIQKDTAALATSHQRAYVLNDMGTGKTRATLWSWRYLRNVGMANKLLVVAPLSTLSFVWLRELMLTMPEVKAVVLHGSREKRITWLAGDYDVYIINHDGLKTIVQELHARTDIDCMIIDELAAYRNNSKRTRQMQVFARRFLWVWGMTGRPMPNAPTDVFNQCKIITPNTLPPKFFTHAKTTLMYQVNEYKWVPRENAIETALSWMQPSVRYSLDDVVELPEYVSRTVDVEMTEAQSDVFQRLSNYYIALIDQKRITVANAGVALFKLLQVGAGYVYTINPEYVTLDSSPRQQMLLELIDEAPYKVIVFAPWRHLVTHLSALLTSKEIDHAVVQGDVLIKARNTIFNDFQNTSRYRVLLAHPSCIHHGVTLTAATTIVWYSPVPSLEVYEQANARIRRIGQKHKQLFLHIQSSTVERHVYQLLRNKKHLQDEFLRLIKTTVPDGDQHARDKS